MRKSCQSGAPQKLSELSLFSFAAIQKCSHRSKTMRWPWSTASSDKDDKRTRVASSTPDWSDFAEPRNIVVSVALTASTLALIRFYKHYLRRIPNGQHIKPSLFRRRSLFGTVTSVGDGDGFRFFHTPGGRLTGWGWLPGRRVPTKREGLKDNTVCYFHRV